MGPFGAYFDIFRKIAKHLINEFFAQKYFHVLGKKVGFGFRCGKEKNLLNYIGDGIGKFLKEYFYLGWVIQVAEADFCAVVSIVIVGEGIQYLIFGCWHYP